MLLISPAQILKVFPLNPVGPPKIEKRSKSGLSDYLTTKESKTIFDQKDLLVLNSLKYLKRESFQSRSEQSFFMDSVT